MVSNAQATEISSPPVIAISGLRSAIPRRIPSDLSHNGLSADVIGAWDVYTNQPCGHVARATRVEEVSDGRRHAGCIVVATCSREAKTTGQFDAEITGEAPIALRPLLAAGVKRTASQNRGRIPALRAFRYRNPLTQAHAVDDLYVRYARPLLSYLYHRLPSLADAEDILAEVFLTALRASTRGETLGARLADGGRAPPGC